MKPVRELDAPEAPGPTPVASVAPYQHASEHLRDELQRLWLRLELEVRRRWESGLLVQPSRGDATLATRIAGAASLPERGGSVQAAGTTDQVLRRYLEHCARIEARVAVTTETVLPMVLMARSFDLTAWEQAVLACALLPEVDPDLLIAYRYLADDPGCRGLDRRLLALLVYDTPDNRPFLVRDLSFDGALMRYRLIEQDEGGAPHEAILYRRLRPAARLVRMLTGEEPFLDPELRGLAVLRPPPPDVVLFSEEVVARAEHALDAQEPVLLVVQGARGTGKRLLVEVAAARRGARTLAANLAAFAVLTPEALRDVVQKLLREAYLLGAVVMVPEIDDLPSSAPDSNELPPLVTALCAEDPCSVAITSCRERLPDIRVRPMVRVQLSVLSLDERALLWEAQAPGLTPEEAMSLAERFAVPGAVIVRATQAARAAGGDVTAEALDAALRDQLEDRLGRLGHRLSTSVGLDALVVDQDTLNALSEIVSAVRERWRVREQWGLRGAAGVSVLFSGGPGVGKTLSATVLAYELQLSIYEIDLSRVVSKWIGETEKHLSEVFDAAEPGHAVLLFNEADSLFGKRTTEVTTSNDRYANLQTNYLLQRLERFGGLAILTTNMTKAIDPAFRRRLAYDVQFPFPTAAMRAELWMRALPEAACAPGLDFERLGRHFELSGGFIKVAAERAAFIAAAADQLVGMDAITMAIERMYRERGKLTASGRLE